MREVTLWGLQFQFWRGLFKNGWRFGYSKHDRNTWAHKPFSRCSRLLDSLDCFFFWSNYSGWRVVNWLLDFCVHQKWRPKAKRRLVSVSPWKLRTVFQGKYDFSLFFLLVPLWWGIACEILTTHGLLQENVAKQEHCSKMCQRKPGSKGIKIFFQNISNKSFRFFLLL